jgi:plasmid replication initiation protein
VNKLIITKDNSLIRAKFSLTLAEQRVILICIGKIKPTETLTTETIFEVTAAELAKFSGASRTSAYQDLKLVVERLYERSIYMEDNIKMRWITMIEHVENTGSAKLTFSQHVIPFISELKGKFTSYDLKNVAQFRSIYAFRIYEILVQFPDLKEQIFKINRLRELLMLDDKYPKSYDFRKWVIDPAIASINDYSNIHVNVEPIKTGKEITSFRFKYVLKREIMTKISN